MKSNRACLRIHLLSLQSVKAKDLRWLTSKSIIITSHGVQIEFAILHLRLIKSARQVANFRSLIATPVLLSDGRASTWCLQKLPPASQPAPLFSLSDSNELRASILVQFACNANKLLKYRNTGKGPQRRKWLVPKCSGNEIIR